MPKAPPDITWQHCSKVDPTNRSKVQCNYCKKIMFGGINRMKNHLGGTKKDVAPCPVAEDHIKQTFHALLMGFEEKKSKANKYLEI